MLFEEALMEPMDVWLKRVVLVVWGIVVPLVGIYLVFNHLSRFGLL